MSVVSFPVGIPQDCFTEVKTDVASRGAQLEDVHVYVLLLNVPISAPPAGFLLENKSIQMIHCPRCRVQPENAKKREAARHRSQESSSFTLITQISTVEGLRRSTEARYFRKHVHVSLACDSRHFVAVHQLGCSTTAGEHHHICLKGENER